MPLPSEVMVMTSWMFLIVSQATVWPARARVSPSEFTTSWVTVTWGPPWYWVRAAFMA